MAIISGHAVLEAADLSLAEEAMPKFPSWPRRLLVAFSAAALLRIALKDLEMGWSHALQLYLFSQLAVLLAIFFGLGRWLTVRPSPEQVMARLGLVTKVLTVELDQEGIVYGSHTKRSWTEFHHFSENERAFVLQGDALLLHMIPKRAFALADIHGARALMLAKVSPTPAPSRPLSLSR